MPLAPPELLAPAGTLKNMRYAFAYGADAVYAGAVTAEQRLQVLKLRLAASELALRAAQSAALHAGAKGYQVRHAAQRRTREAMFVAIVTPAIKHLRKEIHLLEQTTNALEQAS